MEEIGYYRKNEVDCYAFVYFADNKTAVAYHMPMPVGSPATGVGRLVVELENIGTKEDAMEKLRESVDKL